ncbi:MAG: type II secretory pathway pseudopilin PulG/uncharacterized protein YegL [Verrucomicrobiales bacterium]|jgi:type II secretory pathway pseudopilin PulG/uncharacterized protein YegL
MISSCKPASFSRAFSFLEALIAIAVLGVIASVAMMGVGKIRESSQRTKLDSDITTVNHAVKIYLTSGGNLTGVTQPQAILDKLKTKRTAEEAAKYAGLRSTMIDKRLQAVLIPDPSSGDPRAVWNLDKNRFEVATSGVGVISFQINPALAANDYGEEARAGSAIDYNPSDGWIWTFVDTPGAIPPGPDEIPIGGGDPLPPDPPGSPTRLAMPGLSPPGGEFPYPQFPLVVTITNPNDSAISDLYWATEWSGASGISWQPYTGPVSIQPDQQLLAYALSTDPGYYSSYSIGANFVSAPVQLQEPTITASASQLDLETNLPVTISISDPNPPAEPHELQWRMAGGSWQTYTGAFDVLPQTYAAGFTIETRAYATSPGYVDSTEASLILPIKLMMPVITLSDPEFTQSIPTITVSLSNPNPAGSSSPKYKIKNLETGSETGWIVFSADFDLTVAEYPDGFELTAYNNPDAPNYMESDQTTSNASSFFGTGIDGYTIFVLDVSGSMNWNGRIAQMTAEVVSALNDYPATGKFAIVKFSSEASVVYPWSDATASNISAAIAATNAITAGGSTNYSDALDDSLTIIQAAGDVNQVIFLSDGKPSAGDISTAGILNRVTSIASEGAYVDTIGFQINQSGQVLLQSMADTGNGTFTQVE